MPWNENPVLERKQMTRKRSAGFSLIEVMIVAAIIGILSMIAYPSYQDHMRKTKRTDGIAAINKIIQAQERHFTSNFTYETDLTKLGFSTASNIPSEDGHYKVSAAACSGATIKQCVIVTAAAQGGQVSDGNLSLNSRGSKKRGTHTGWD